VGGGLGRGLGIMLGGRIGLVGAVGLLVASGIRAVTGDSDGLDDDWGLGAVDERNGTTVEVGCDGGSSDHGGFSNNGLGVGEEDLMINPSEEKSCSCC
jgi:hypothetical protein